MANCDAPVGHGLSRWFEKVIAMRTRGLCMAGRAVGSAAVGVVVSLGLLAGCGGGGGPDSQTVGPAGGTVTSAGGEISLVFPANAVAGALLVGITEDASVPAAPTGLSVVPNTAYEFGPAGTQFAQPVTLTIRYAQADIPGGVNESSLGVYTVANEAWQAVQGSAVDASADAVSAPITSFSTYGVLGGAPPSVTVTIGGADPVELVPGATHQFSATVTGAANTAVTWSASGGAIDASGLYTAPSTRGAYSVTARSQADTTASDSVQVNVVTGGMHVIVG